MSESTGIKNWAEDDRPREKLLQQGARALTDSEIIAILIRAGTRNDSAVEVARKLLKAANNDITELSRWSVERICKSGVKGLGEVKAITIAAALELGKRRRESDKSNEIKSIRSSSEAFNELYPSMADLPHEEFWILFLNQASHIIRKESLSIGGTAGTVVDPKKVYRRALELSASKILLAHNHPSGNLKPSEQDIRLTRKLVNVGNELDLLVMDHLIIAGNSYYSFADEGLM